MSLNWVMLSSKEGFVRLPNEHIIYTSPPRTALSLKPPNSWKGREDFSITSSSGCLYLTNQRIVYLPSQPNERMQSFTVPLLNLHDSHVSAPWFGPNAWTVLVQPVSGGGIPASLQLVELKVTFNEGGAFDFHSNFERIKERLQQAVEHARDSDSASVQAQTSRGVNFTNVHLDELPAYDGPNASSVSPNQPINAAVEPPGRETANTTSPAPVEPPPGYEEVQQQSVAEELEEQLRRAC
ncbi:hypothetical protein EYB25_007805 [Talaromyces marneffei]|uniref:Uncharacterized protein n=1 Tax=Talaromyces marneffei PM1 TaxID=1077442 RepID=A0A093V8S5_TALMA|nr:uncharacterized protein EYB26_005357 [Talaromyces marneffei]KAE8549285.1 hypothetical protein EYB25_007805 [Talaromyces marneffei]QGA17682.1 hypothetical protein EYB26_005357 [Talaromyces marneffei]